MINNEICHYNIKPSVNFLELHNYYYNVNFTFEDEEMYAVRAVWNDARRQEYHSIMENDTLIDMYGFENIISIAPIQTNNSKRFEMVITESLIIEAENPNLFVIEPT